LIPRGTLALLFEGLAEGRRPRDELLQFDWVEPQAGLETGSPAWQPAPHLRWKMV